MRVPASDSHKDETISEFSADEADPLAPTYGYLIQVLTSFGAVVRSRAGVYAGTPDAGRKAQ